MKGHRATVRRVWVPASGEHMWVGVCSCGTFLHASEDGPAIVWDSHGFHLEDAWRHEQAQPPPPITSRFQ